MFRPRREITIPPHYTPDHPDSREGTHIDTQDPYNTQITVDTRPVMLKKRAPILVPQFNKYYGSDRVEGSWRYIVDNFAISTLTTIANTTVSTKVNLTNAPNWRLSQWPDAINLFLCIRKFSLAPQSAITTVGAIDCQFIDQFGNTIPLGDFVNNSNINEDIDVLIPTPITDPGNTAVGTLITTLTGTTPTVSVYNFQMGFSGAYLLPDLEGYRREDTHRVEPPWRQDT